MKALALDLGGTHIGCGLVDDGKLLAHTSIPSDGAHSLLALLPVVAQTLRKLLAEAEISAQCCSGIGISFPGIVDVYSNSILSTLKKYEDAPDIDLGSWSGETFGLPMRIESDARMALIGESFAGAGRGVANIVMVTLGTGIGTAAMIRGHLLRGVHAHAGCLGGHLPG